MDQQDRVVGVWSKLAARYHARFCIPKDGLTRRVVLILAMPIGHCRERLD
jgi:hypothetical protein